MTPAELFVREYADEFGGVPPQTAATLTRLVNRQLEAPYREMLAAVEEELAATRRSSVAQRSLARLAEMLRAKLPPEPVVEEVIE